MFTIAHIHVTTRILREKKLKWLNKYGIFRRMVKQVWDIYVSEFYECFSRKM